MKKRIKRIICMFYVLALCLTLLPGAAPADKTDDRNYVTLGDSISTGYGLTDPDTQSFPALAAEQTGCTLTNLAEDGETSASLLEKLTDNTVDIRDADLISVTVGGNDLMNALYAFLAEKYNEGREEAEYLNAEEISDALISKNMTVLMSAVTNIPLFAGSEQAETAFSAFETNLNAIIGRIREINPDVRIILVNQYNPYGHIASPLAEEIVDAFDAGVRALNEKTAAAAQDGVIVADVYDAFEDAQENPCNASFSSLSDLNLDFHPNAAGHSLIAGVVAQAIFQENPEPSESLPFADVPSGAWYEDAVRYVCDSGLMNGTGAGSFEPYTAASRGMMVTIFWRMEGSPVVNYLMNFSDVDPESYYGEAVRWAASEGIVNGCGDDIFRPDDPVTRQQLAAMFQRYAQHEEYDMSADENAVLSSYTDADRLSGWAVSAMQWACGTGLISGIDSVTLDPQGQAVRAQIAVMLQRFCERYS